MSVIPTGPPVEPQPIEPSDSPPISVTPADDSIPHVAVVTREPTSSRPIIGLGDDTDLDGISNSLEIALGLDPDKRVTEKTIGDREPWAIPGTGYAGYGDDVVSVAMHKYTNLFGGEAATNAGNGYWEAYSSSAEPIASGSWLPSEGKTVSEGDFERIAGVPIWGDPNIGPVAYELMRKAAAPQDAVFALRKANGYRLGARSSDQVVPTIERAGELHEVKLMEASAKWWGGGTKYFDAKSGEAFEGGDVVWRLKAKAGTIRGSADDLVESREELLGLEQDVAFDFLDKMGNRVEYAPWDGDRIAATWKDGEKSLALRPRHNSKGRTSSYQLYELSADGTEVKSSKKQSLKQGQELYAAHADEIVHRIQTRDGVLKGDGETGKVFDQSWWGRCQNVAAIDQSNLPQPDRDIFVVSNVDVEAGDVLAMGKLKSDGHHVFVPNRDEAGKVTDYDHQVRGPRGGVLKQEAVTEARAQKLIGENGTPVIVRADRSLKDAEFELVTAGDATIMTALMHGDVADDTVSIGKRYHSVSDLIVVNDGSGEEVREGHVTSVKTAGGEEIVVATFDGTEWRDEGTHGAMLRGEGFETAVGIDMRTFQWVNRGLSTMEGINARREGDAAIVEVVVEGLDGTKETLAAESITTIARQNPFDLTPLDILEAASHIEDGKSLTIEKATLVQVWNYGARSISFEPLEGLPNDPDDPDRTKELKEANALPGAMAGTIGDDNKVYFNTTLETINGSKLELVGWMKFVLGDDGQPKLDAEGKPELVDFNWLSGSPPDFFWKKHVRDPIEGMWTGEGNVPGTDMGVIQGLYNAGTGAYKDFEVLGALSTHDILHREATRP